MSDPSERMTSNVEHDKSEPTKWCHHDQDENPCYYCRKDKSNVERDELHERAKAFLTDAQASKSHSLYETIRDLDESRERLKVALAETESSRDTYYKWWQESENRSAAAAKIVELAVCPLCHDKDGTKRIYGYPPFHCTSTFHSLIQEWRKGQK